MATQQQMAEFTAGFRIFDKDGDGTVTEPKVFAFLRNYCRLDLATVERHFNEYMQVLRYGSGSGAAPTTTPSTSGFGYGVGNEQNAAPSVPTSSSFTFGSPSAMASSKYSFSASISGPDAEYAESDPDTEDADLSPHERFAKCVTPRNASAGPVQRKSNLRRGKPVGVRNQHHKIPHQKSFIMNSSPGRHLGESNVAPTSGTLADPDVIQNTGQHGAHSDIQPGPPEDDAMGMVVGDSGLKTLKRKVTEMDGWKEDTEAFQTQLLSFKINKKLIKVERVDGSLAELSERGQELSKRRQELLEEVENLKNLLPSCPAQSAEGVVGAVNQFPVGIAEGGLSKESLNKLSRIRTEGMKALQRFHPTLRVCGHYGMGSKFHALAAKYVRVLAPLHRNVIAPTKWDYFTSDHKMEGNRLLTVGRRLERLLQGKSFDEEKDKASDEELVLMLYCTFELAQTVPVESQHQSTGRRRT